MIYANNICNRPIIQILFFMLRGMPLIRKKFFKFQLFILYRIVTVWSVRRTHFSLQRSENNSHNLSIQYYIYVYAHICINMCCEQYVYVIIQACRSELLSAYSSSFLLLQYYFTERHLVSVYEVAYVKVRSPIRLCTHMQKYFFMRTSRVHF